MRTTQNQIFDLRAGERAPVRCFRLGVTELRTLTWLARLVSAIRGNYPTVDIEPEVDVT